MKLFLNMIIGLIFLLTGCTAYTTKNILPENAKSIYIPIFSNETYKQKKIEKAFKRNIDNIVTDQVIKQFLLDQSLRVVSKNNADLLLEGHITDYTISPLRYSHIDSDVVEEYRIEITVVLNLIDLRTNKPIWKNETIKQREDYYVGGTTLSTEDSAVIQAAEDLAKKIISQVVEGW